MKLEGKVDLSEYNRAITSLAGWSEKSASKIFKEESRLLFERIIQGPKGVGGKRGLATPPETRAQGINAVKRDVYRAIKPLRASDYSDKTIARAIRTKPYDFLQEMAKRGAFGEKLKNARIGLWEMDWHKEQRDKRGIVSKKSTYRYATKDIEGLNSYVRYKQYMVGQGKGGWAKALIAAGGTPLRWIGRHKESGVESHCWVGDNLFAWGINYSAWASLGDTDRIVASAISNRIHALESKVKDAIVAYADMRGLV